MHRSHPRAPQPGIELLLRRCSHQELALSKPQGDLGLRRVCWGQLGKSCHTGDSQRGSKLGGQGAEQWWSVNPTEDSQGGDSRAGNEPDSEDA